MDRSQTLLTQLASTLIAYKNCENVRNSEWKQKWDERLTALEGELPSGSGFDNGTAFNRDASNDRKLVFETSFHHMNDVGMYDGWTEHTVTVVPTFTGVDIKVSGRNRNDIKDYIADAFLIAFDMEVPSYMQA